MNQHLAADPGLPERDSQAALARFHAEVDAAAAALAAHHGARLHCRRGCAPCCVDDLTVFEVEAERIRRNAPQVLREAPHAVGACAFLDAEGACRVYEDRPYVCRTQGLPLRAFTESPDGELHEDRDICPLNAEGPALITLDDDELWTLGPHELRLQQLQARFADGGQRRVRLRDLFPS